MRKPKDWGQHCPNPDYPPYRLLNQGNISAISTSLTQSGKRRLFLCHVCAVAFSETRDTVFFALRTHEEKVMLALKLLLVKVGLSDMIPTPRNSCATYYRNLLVYHTLMPDRCA
jgi:hypothetical protein